MSRNIPDRGEQWAWRSAYDAAHHRQHCHSLLCDWVSVKQLNLIMYKKIWLIDRYFLRLLVCPNKKKFVSDKMNLVDLIGILPTIFSVILAGLENMKIIGQVWKINFYLPDCDVMIRPARLWGQWGWWGSCASSGWFATLSGSKAFSIPCTRCFSYIVPSFLIRWFYRGAVDGFSPAGVAWTWINPSDCAHHHSRLLKPHIQLWAGRAKTWEMVRKKPWNDTLMKH